MNVAKIIKRVNMNMKEFGIVCTRENKLDDDELCVLSVTTRPEFKHRMFEWRNTGAYSQAWNLIADTLKKLMLNLHCDIDDNYLRVFYKNEKEANAVYTVLELLQSKIDDCFI